MNRVRKDNPQPYYLQAKEALQRAFAAGEYNGGNPLPDERTLSTQLGLARMTLRRALGELEAEGWLKRIPGRGTFVRQRNVIARSDSSRRLSIAMLSMRMTHTPDSLFYLRVMQGLQRACGEMATLSLHDAGGADLEKRFKEEGVSGAVVLGVSDPALLNVFAKMTLPVVLCDCVRPRLEGHYDFVTHANEEGAYLATRGLIDLGHRDILMFVHGNGVDGGKWRLSDIASERREGFLRAMNEQKCPVKPENIVTVAAASSPAYSVFRQRLDRAGPPPTAVVCSTDELALGVMEAARDYGLKVPRDLSVTGFGDIGLFTQPRLSTIRMQMEESGAQAIKMLSERMTQPQLPGRTLRLGVEMIHRETCAVPHHYKKVSNRKSGGKST